MNTEKQVDYVIRCTPEQLDEALLNCTGIARRVLGGSRPLSELCEAEAKKYEYNGEAGGRWETYRANRKKFLPTLNDKDKEYFFEQVLIALRSFGSN